MPASFTVDSYFNKDAQFKKVVFGADAKITEAELNEAQDIQNFRTARLLQVIFGSRPLYMGTYTISSGKLNIANEYVSIDGEIILLTSTDFAVAIGDSVYLNKIESVKAHTDGIKRYGDLSTSTTVANSMLDARIGEETTRRLQVTYQLTKVGTGTGTFQKLCDIVNNGSGQPMAQKLTFSDTSILADARAISTALATTAETNAINFTKDFGLGDVAKDISSTDLNNLDATGFYRGSNLANSPNTGNAYFILHFKNTATSKSQLLLRYNSAVSIELWQRTQSSGTWSSWAQLETTAGAQAKADERPIDSRTYITDANAITKTGFYITNLTWTGSPIAGSSGANQGYLEHHSWSGNGSSYATQIHTQVDLALVKRFRYKDNGVWSAWVTLETTAGAQTKADTAETNAKNWAKGFGLGDMAKSITAGTDINTISATGFYQGYNLVNSPNPTGTVYFYIIHMRFDDSYNSQIAIKFSDGTTYTRTESSGVWSAWAQQETTTGAQAKVDTHAGSFTLHTPYVVSAGTGTAYTATLTPAPTLVKGLSLRLEIHLQNTGSATLNVNGLGAKTIKKGNGGTLSAGNLKLGSVYTLVYNGTDFILQGEGGSGNAQPSEVLATKTFSNDSGDQTGTMPNKTGILNTNTTWANASADDSVSVVVPQGYYPGGEFNVQVVDTNLMSSNIKAGVNIFGVSGTSTVSDTNEATNPAGAGHILAPKVAFVNGSKVTGTMPTVTTSFTPSTANQTIPAGYHAGTGTVAGDADLLPGNIRAGVDIFGVVGKTEVVDTTEATLPAGASEVLSTKVAFVNGTKVTGTMPNNGAGGTVTPGTSNQSKPAGYYSTAITITGDADLVSANIKAGADIFGVAGKAEVVDTSEAIPANVPTANEVLVGKVAFVNGAKVTGTMTNNGAWNATPGTASIAIPWGLHSGGGTIAGDADLVSANIKSGVNIFGVAGAPNVVDTTEATKPAVAGEILTGEVAFVNGAKVTGTMANNGAWGVTPGTANVTVPAGFHSGTGVIAGDADLVSANIKAGANIFGVAGATNVVDTTEATTPASASEILSGEVAFVNGAKVTGTMANNGAGGTVTPGTSNQTKPAGYYSSAITITGDSDLVSANIKAGVNLFGVVGKTEVVDTFTLSPAVSADMLSGKIAYVNGTGITGNMPNNGAVNFTPSTTNQTIPAGYHSGTGVVSGDTDLVSANIKAGINIFGVNGKTEVVDTSEATSPASAGQILTGKIGFVNGSKVTGTMANQSAVTAGTFVSTTAGAVKATIPQGAYLTNGASGSPEVTVTDANLITGNIRSGVTIFGVSGNTNVVNTSEGITPANASLILTGYKAFVNGALVTGTMANQGAPSFTPGASAIPLSAGYYSGGSVAGDADLVAGNIASDTNIFGVQGTLERFTSTNKTDTLNTVNGILDM